MAPDKNPFRPRLPSLDVLSEQLNSLSVAMTRMENQLAKLEREVREGGYVSRSEFKTELEKKVDKEGQYWLVQRLVFWGAGMVLAAALAAGLFALGWTR